MSRSEQVLSIFLASPGDLADERGRLAEAITQWNRAWSRDQGLRLELLRWEDDAYPDMGEDAQDVINKQVPDDWDMFIGIMWSRFGTPTGRAGSGTQEEFERALVRIRTAPEVALLFYFKDAPIAPSKIDVDQLHLVQQFKQSAKSKGLLTWDFSDADQFEKLVALHLTKHVQEWRRSNEGGSRPSNVPHQPTEVAIAASDEGPGVGAIEDQDDSGYLDLLETFGERSTEMGEIATRLAAAQSELTERSSRGRQELEEIRANPSDSSSKQARKSIARVAEEMLKFTACVEEEVPRLHVAIDGAMSALTRLVTITAELYPEQLESSRAAGVSLLQTLIAARQSTEGFRDSTSALPRMTKELNVAKRKQTAALSALVAEFENGERLLAEGLAVIFDLTNRKGT